MAIERIQLRRGTAQQWTDTDPILGAAEIGVELGTPNKFKIGDGSSLWSELEYFNSGSVSNLIPLSQKGAANGVATLDATGAIPTSQLANIIASAPSTLDTLNELAAALGDDANFASTILNAISGKADTTHTHTKSQITDFAHTHTKSDITDFSHTHNASEITNTIVEVSSSSYAIQASDNGKMLVITGSSPVTITINNVLSVGNRIDIYLRGNTTVTFSAGTGTVESTALTMSNRYTVASIMCVASNVYTVVGNVS
jgi:hypothetical protein